MLFFNYNEIYYILLLNVLTFIKLKIVENNKQRIDNAIESYKFRPQVERDEERMQQKTASHVAKLGKELDKVFFVKGN